MATLEQMQAQIEQLMAAFSQQASTVTAQARELADAKAEIVRLRAAQEARASTPASSGPSGDFSAQLATALEQLKEQNKVMASLAQKPTMIDNKGLGKPSQFKGDDEHWQHWKIKTINYVIGSFPQLSKVFEWIQDITVPINHDLLRDVWGSGADPSEEVEDIDGMNIQFFTVLTSLCE